MSAEKSNQPITKETRAVSNPTAVEAVPSREEEGLPTNFKVERIKYKLVPDFKTLTFKVEETVSGTITEPSKEIVLNGLGLDVHSAQYKTQDGQIHSPTITPDKENQTTTFAFDTQLSEGKGELNLSFTGDFKAKNGRVRKEMNGLYLTTWKDDKGKPHYWALTQFEPTDARRMLFLPDQPDRKLVVEATIATPEGLEAVSNNVVIDVHKENGLDLYQFEETPLMSTYLHAAVIGEFGKIKATDRNGVHHSVITPPGLEELGRFALESSLEILPFLADWTEIPYRISKKDENNKLDAVAAPEFEAGAMENWGLEIFRQSSILIDLQNSSQSAKERVFRTKAHEDSHMYFGNLATLKNWTYLWLNESFARYMEYVTADHIHPEWKIWDGFIHEQQNRALHLDALKNTHPIEIEVHNPREIGEIFDHISYNKGASIIKMLADYINRENFRKGTSDYLKKYQYSNATTQDLLEAYEERSELEGSRLPVREVMENWLHKPGYPVITVTDTNDGNLELTQERFFFNTRSRAKENDTTVWQIPLWIHTEGKKAEFTLMKEKTIKIPKPGKGNWLLVNEGAGSFVRVDYPQEYLNSLRQPLEQGIIGFADRYALIRDCFDLAQGGISSVDKALKFLESYKKETNFTVWSAIADKLANVNNIIDGEDPRVRDKFNFFARSIFQEIGQKMGWEKKDDETNKDAFLRALAIENLAKYGDEETIMMAQKKFEEHFTGQTPLDPDLRAAVYGIVAANGGEDEYNKLMDLYHKNDFQEERRRILTALGSFKKPEIIDRVLRFMIPPDGEEGAPKAETYIMFDSLGKNSNARAKLWEFTKSNWDGILELYKDTQTSLPYCVNPMEQFHSSEDARDFERFFTENDPHGAKRAVQQVIEMIDSKADWLARDRDKIISFLDNYSSSKFSRRIRRFLRR